MLEVLNIAGTLVTDATVTALASLPLLVELQLGNTDISARGMHCLHPLPLRRIGVPARERVDDSMLHVLFRFPLETLSLRACNLVTDDGLDGIEQLAPTLVGALVARAHMQQPTGAGSVGDQDHRPPHGAHRPCVDAHVVH